MGSRDDSSRVARHLRVAVDQQGALAPHGVAVENYRGRVYVGFVTSALAEVWELGPRVTGQLEWRSR